MKLTTRTLRGVALSSFVVAMAFGPLANAASTPSSPAERAATAELNRQIAATNAANEERALALEAQYEEQKRQSDEAERRYQQYQSELSNYQTTLTP